MGSFVLLRCRVLILLGFALLAACSGPQVASGIYDPYEDQNRAVHAENRALDRGFVRPLSNGYGRGIPEPIRIGVGNFASNLAIPGSVVNDLLQARVDDALHNTFRFLVNTVFGLGGILDPATEAGLEPRVSNFGETLHVWGVGEGAYVELPILGPSTSRDAAGKFVDLFLDPFAYVVPAPAKYVLPFSSVVARVGDRYRFRETVDSVLYDSSDSYAQASLLYLDSRRYELGQAADADDDLYEGLYDDLIPE